MPTCRCYFVGALPSCIWGGKIAAMKVGFFGLKADPARRSERVAKIRNQEGKGRERAAETGRSSRGERTIAELSACRYDEYAELRS